MTKLIVFIILSIPLVIVSWRTLFKIKTHGFFRFFAWECILWLLINNYIFWFENPFGLKQILSWLLLFYSLILLITGILQLIKFGKPHKSRNEKQLFNMEKTTLLVVNGIYKYIRHPIYGSLIFLTWGIYLKNTDLILTIFAILSTILLFITSKYDEKECIVYFGQSYKEYMTHSRMFVPNLF
ncbi:MAG: isoprenylcysteine carboxylmethyltransferase family protein [Ignavibacteriae bacterium]|nr:isoprenylcysteine carboxylmethyltransferase family protein [Ignavibacteriota bacterium]